MGKLCLEESKQQLQGVAGNKPLPQQSNQNLNSTVDQSYKSIDQYSIVGSFNKQSEKSNSTKISKWSYCNTYYQSK